ncbi:hypothetical protein NIBR502774_12540 [Rhizobium sp. NIBRBAC000502774]|nr:hypothetical protein NIBR502774_12540 [Rhizobium sp. NIBRBAC000502774]
MIDTARQHTGGLAGQLGYRFQTLVVVRAILEAAANNSGDNPLFEQEARDSSTDDLHAIWDTQYRDHYQIKAVKDLSWLAALVRQFKYEARKHPSANLKLIVDNEQTMRSMAANRHDYELGFVEVDYLDRGWVTQPYLNFGICKWLEQLSLMPSHPTRDAAMWNHIYSTWVNDFGGGNGHIKKLFAHISRTSGYTISSLKPTTSDMNLIAFELGEAIPDLEFSADGYTIVATTERGRTLIPFPGEWAKIDADFWNDYPTDPWAFLGKFGGFKSDIDDELDEDW